MAVRATGAATAGIDPTAARFRRVPHFLVMEWEKG